MKILHIAACLSALCFYVYASDEGTSGASTLARYMGARSAGIAQACTAVDGTVESIYFNPAGLGSLTSRQFAFSYSGTPEGGTLGSFNIGKPFGSGTYAIGFKYFDAGTMDLIDSGGSETTVTAQQDTVYELSYARFFSYAFSFGATLKMLSSKLIEKYSASTFAADLGILYKKNGFTFGAAALNNGGGLKYISESDPLPSALRAGVSSVFGKVRVSADAVKPNDSGLRENIGVEYNLLKYFTLRAGGRLSYDLDSLTLGAGFNHRRTQIDYGMRMMGDLGPAQYLTVTLSY